MRGSNTFHNKFIYISFCPNNFTYFLTFCHDSFSGFHLFVSFYTTHDDSNAHVIYFLFHSLPLMVCMELFSFCERFRQTQSSTENVRVPFLLSCLIQTQLQRKRRSTCGCMKGNAKPRVKRQHMNENIMSPHLIPHSSSEKYISLS